MTAIIFAGPTLPPPRRPQFAAGFDWRPPVRQGELYRAALGRPAVIGVVDGYFEVTPTVWHKEILWTMTQGIHVFGAASIGALRAAELAPFGMRGVGRIFADFRDGVLQDDDEVAVSHGPMELGYPPLTQAMVDIRATLAQARHDAVIGASVAAALTQIAKALFYKERTYRAMLDAGAAAGLDAIELARLDAWLPTGRIEQKQRDALAMLEAISAHLVAAPTPLRVPFTLADTAAWRAARRSAEAGTGTPTRSEK